MSGVLATHFTGSTQRCWLVPILVVCHPWPRCPANQCSGTRRRRRVYIKAFEGASEEPVRVDGQRYYPLRPRTSSAVAVAAGLKIRVSALQPQKTDVTHQVEPCPSIDGRDRRRRGAVERRMKRLARRRACC
ncbi:hypothetical protein CPC08DRAFT_711751 [Agrocybe pediades]|nr:hypothetical protein CPC08DRAFT_711751 [Agrocybe pediades]